MDRLNGHEWRRTIGHRIYLERTARRLSQRDISTKIADRYGSHNAPSADRISRIELGKANYLDVIEVDLIAQALDVPPINLIKL